MMVWCTPPSSQASADAILAAKPIAYHFPSSGSVVRASYSRLFTPPPIEYVLLASYLGSASDVEEDRVGNVRPYRQHLFEGGWSQRIHPQLFLDVGAYHHSGKNSFENSEIANTRLFVPTNFGGATASGLDIALTLRPEEPVGFSGRIQYALAEVKFAGPVTGGLPGEELEPLEKLPPAFDQRHTIVANAAYRSPWRRLETGVIFRYGSGTPIEGDGGGFVYVPDHLSLDLMARVGLWSANPKRVDLELSATNLTNNIYSIAKESEFTPIQYAPRRSILAELRFGF